MYPYTPSPCSSSSCSPVPPRRNSPFCSGCLAVEPAGCVCDEWPCGWPRSWALTQGLNKPHVRPSSTAQRSSTARAWCRRGLTLSNRSFVNACDLRCAACVPTQMLRNTLWFLMFVSCLNSLLLDLTWTPCCETWLGLLGYETSFGLTAAWLDLDSLFWDFIWTHYFETSFGLPAGRLDFDSLLWDFIWTPWLWDFTWTPCCET